MLKKILIGALLLAFGFVVKDIKSGEEVVLVNILIYGGIGLAAFALKEWTDVPYDWDKHKNKDKKKNLN